MSVHDEKILHVSLECLPLVDITSDYYWLECVLFYIVNSLIIFYLILREHKLIKSVNIIRNTIKTLVWVAMSNLAAGDCIR